MLGEHIVLNECLLEKTAQSETLVSVVLYLVGGLFVLAHLYILLELFNLSVLHLRLQLNFSVLALQLLHKEGFQVVGFLAHRRVGPSVHVVGLMLQLPRQVFNFLFFLAQIDVHLLGLGAQASVLVASNIVLNLQVAIHVSHFLFLRLLKDGSLICLEDIRVLLLIEVVIVDSAAYSWHLLTRCNLLGRGRDLAA